MSKAYLRISAHAAKTINAFRRQLRLRCKENGTTVVYELRMMNARDCRALARGVALDSQVIMVDDFETDEIRSLQIELDEVKSEAALAREQHAVDLARVIAERDAALERLK